MDSEFKKYLRDFGKLYNIDFRGVDFDCVSDFQSLLKQLESNSVDVSTIQGHLEVIFDLQKKGVHIYEDNYKNSDQYLEIKDDWIPINEDDVMSTENYIEHFLLDKNRLLDLYDNESIYAMGNPYELDDSECKLATVLMKKFGFLDNNEIENEIKEKDEPGPIDPITEKIKDADIDFIKALLRACNSTMKIGKLANGGGLISRLHQALRFDIEEFLDNKKYKAEICKIIYFFYEMEHTPIIPKLQGKMDNVENIEGRSKLYFNLIKFLYHPSMENNSYSFSRRERYNGKITELIKAKLEKEIYLKEASIKELNNIKKGFKSILDTWNNVLSIAREAVDKNRPFDFEQMNCTFGGIKFWMSPEEIMKFRISENSESESESEPYISEMENTYQASPIVALYFKILQF